MILAIDCGNTNIVFTLYRETGDRAASWRAESRAGMDADALMVPLRATLAGLPPEADRITGAVIASVVPALTAVLEELCADRLGVPVTVVGEPGVDLGLDIAIDHPEQVGADRLANALGAAHKGYLPAVILDFGTATTFDIVLPARPQSHALALYDGGVIAPGVHRSVEALVAAAAKLPPIEVKSWPADQPLIGKSTKTAMQSGILWGYVCLIDGMITRIKSHYNQPMQVIATGGLAHLFAPHISQIEVIDCDLTTDALFQLYRTLAARS